MKRYGVVLADPDDRDVLNGDQHPAREDQALDAGIARVAFAHDDLRDKRVVVRPGNGSSSKEVEEAGEHDIGG